MRAIILAAGSSSRVGTQKLLLSFRSRPLVEYSIAAAARWRPVVVCGPDVAGYLAGRSEVTLVCNDKPQLGMSHSLTLANLAIEEDVAIGVLLADKPLVSEELIEAILHAARGADVTYPQRESEPGHPVVLSPRARRLIDGLPPGDTLRLLRAAPELIVRPVDTSDDGAFFDVDTIEAFER